MGGKGEKNLAPFLLNRHDHVMAKIKTKLINLDVESSKRIVNEFETLSDVVAESNYYMRDHQCDVLVKAFAALDADGEVITMRNRHLCEVGKYYPDAKGGPLYVDEPGYKYEMQEALLKRKVFIENGMRYLYIEPSSTLEDLYNQLSQLKIKA